MSIRKIVIMLGILIVCGLFIVVKKSKQVESNLDTLVIGTAAGYAPFVSINNKGEYEGFDIDVAHALAHTMGKKLIIKDYGSMSSLFMALDQGMVDALIWGLSITQERLQKFAMINYHGSNIDSYPLIFWKSIPQGVTSLDDMNGKTVCVEPGSSQYAAVRDRSDIILVMVEKIDDALLALSYGKVDAALVEPAIAKKFKALCPEIQILNVSVPASLHENGCGIVIKKNEQYLYDDLYSAIARLKNQGTLAQFERKWGMIG